tara:strand:- start:5631 stop:5909 length:279 start_codon:yes stop_codon:yes gene_type:complete
MKVTKKEYEFLTDIMNSDYSSDGHGFNDYITEHDYDMKVVRGLIPSLVEKGIIVYNEDTSSVDCEGNTMAGAYVEDKYQDIDNHKLINLEVA